MKLTKSNNNMKVKIKDLCEAINGSAFKPTEWSENGLKIVRIQNLNGSEVFNFYNGNIEKKVLIDNEDIVFSWSGSIGTSFGAFKWNGDTALLNQHIFKIVPKENVDNHWLYFQLKYNTNKIEKLAHGAGGLVHVKKGDFESFEISLQSFSEQVKISNILINEENKIKKIKKLLEKIEIRNQYYAEKLLTGELNVNNLSVNTEYKNTFMNNRDTKVSLNFNIDKVKNIFNVSRGKVISKEYIDKHIGDYPVYSSATLNNGEIGRINSYQLDGKYITWTTDGVYAGTVFYRDGKFNCTNICGILDIKIDGNLKYFSIILKKYLPLFVTKLGNSKLMSNTVEEIEIPFTKNIDEQNKIANFIEKLETEKEKVEKLLKLEEQRFEWLSDKLLSGEYIIEGDVDANI